MTPIIGLGVEQQQPPLYWLIDYESGVLQLYAEIDSNGKITGTEIIIPTTNPPNAYQVHVFHLLNI